MRLRGRAEKKIWASPVEGLLLNPKRKNRESDPATLLPPWDCGPGHRLHSASPAGGASWVGVRRWRPPELHRAARASGRHGLASHGGLLYSMRQIWAEFSQVSVLAGGCAEILAFP